MPRVPHPPYSWRSDPHVPAWPDDRPLFVFDGHCVLCSTGAALLMRRDRTGRVSLASAQRPLGAALFRHFGIDSDTTYLFIDRGQAWTKSAGYLHLFRALGGWWRLLEVETIIPERLRDLVYDRVAANRYRWFGRAEQCELLTPEQRRRLL